MNNPSHSSATDRRASERFSPDPAPRCRLLPTGQAELTAVVLDISVGGAGLSLGPPIAAGQELMLKLRRAGLPPLEVPGRVVYCAPQTGAGGAILGCQFMAPLGEEEVRAVLRTVR